MLTAIKLSRLILMREGSSRFSGWQRGIDPCALLRAGKHHYNEKLSVASISAKLLGECGYNNDLHTLTCFTKWRKLSVKKRRSSTVSPQDHSSHCEKRQSWEPLFLALLDMDMNISTILAPTLPTIHGLLLLASMEKLFVDWYHAGPILIRESFTKLWV